MTLIIQHEDDCTPGSAVQWCQSRKVDFRVFKPSQEQSWPSLSDFNNVIICGGSMNVDQEAQHPWLNQEKQLIRQAIKDQKKMVGLCLGGQLLAEALGAKVGAINFTEAGWQKMNILSSSVLDSPALELDVFQWHSYGFSEVPGSVAFATNAIWKNQGFTFGDRILAFQFHPEADMIWMNSCIDNKDFPEGPFCQPRALISDDLDAKQSKMQNWFFSTLDQFFKNS